MIHAPRPRISTALPSHARTRLEQRQAAANGYAHRDPRIEPAWTNFRRSSAGRAVLAALQSVFRGKCAFCERVNARAIDHFRPKERYPRWMFRWPNFLLCCAECNLAKGSYFPLLGRKPVLIDPTREDPLRFYVWDLRTGAMNEVADPHLGHRARTTRDRLKLDDNPLRDERRMQLNRVLKLLSEVVNDHPHIRPDTLLHLQDELHPARPNLGIIRFLFRQQNLYRPIVDDARAKLPEIDRWIAGWV